MYPHCWRPSRLGVREKYQIADFLDWRMETIDRLIAKKQRYFVKFRKWYPIGKIDARGTEIQY